MSSSFEVMMPKSDWQLLVVEQQQVVHWQIMKLAWPTDDAMTCNSAIYHAVY